MKLIRLLIGCLLVSIFIAPFPVSAHEAYVINSVDWQRGLTAAPVNLLNSLDNSANLTLVLIVSILSLVVLILAVLFDLSKTGQKFDRWWRQFTELARLTLRLLLGLALLIGAWQGSVFGPEILISGLPAASLIQASLYGLALLTILGWMSELTAIILVIIYALVIWTYGAYGFTYLSYLGPILALLIFGAGRFSLDRLTFGRNRTVNSADKVKSSLKLTPLQEDLEGLIIRLTYAIALIYTAVTVKFIHPAISLAVVEQYQLTQFGWLFPTDPNLLVLGAGIVECVIGLALIIGWQIRLVVLVSLFYLILALFFFGEAVWPHLIMFGLSIYLLITNGGQFTFDRFLRQELKQVKA